MTEEERRRVPRRAGTSHAAFVSLDRDDLGRARAVLRFFTATGELPGCGHGTIAALAFLAESSGLTDPVTLVAGGRCFAGQATRANGRLTAAFDPGDIRVREASADERDVALASLGRSAEIDASDICVASLGRPRLLVPISTPAALAALQPDLDRLRDGCDRLGLLGCYVHSAPTRDGRLAARMFAPSIGVPEDIANANSTACLAARLAGRGFEEVTVDMGDALGVPATITAAARETSSGFEVRVGGAASCPVEGDP